MARPVAGEDGGSERLAAAARIRNHPAAAAPPNATTRSARSAFGRSSSETRPSIAKPVRNAGALVAVVTRAGGLCVARINGFWSTDTGLTLIRATALRNRVFPYI